MNKWDLSYECKFESTFENHEYNSKCKQIEVDTQYYLNSVQSLSRVRLFTTPWTTGSNTGHIPIHHQLPELTQTHVHRVSDAIQPSHPLSFPSLPAFNLSQHQCLFKSVSSLHQMAKVLEFQLQHQPLQLIFRTDFLWYGLVGSLCCPRYSQESSPTPQFKSINSLALRFLYSPALTSMHNYWKNHSFDQIHSKESACSMGDLDSIPWFKRFPEGGNGNFLQYSFLENPMDRGAWRVTVHGIADWDMTE